MPNNDGSNGVVRPIIPWYNPTEHCYSLSRQTPPCKIPRLSGLVGGFSSYQNVQPSVGLGLGLATGCDEDHCKHHCLGKSSPNSNDTVFTASQVQELQWQWMVYKYLEAGVEVPPTLLVPLHNMKPTTLYHLWSAECERKGRGREEDEEPGRCRRTDGKKWRCSKEALPDHKYCDKHIHRGRTAHRSRKPVESRLTTVSQTANLLSKPDESLI